MYKSVLQACSESHSCPRVASGVRRSQCWDVVQGELWGPGRRLVKRGTDLEAEAQESSGEEGLGNIGTTSERGLGGQAHSFPTPVRPSAHGHCLGSRPQGLQGLLTHLPAPSHLPVERSHGFKSPPTHLGLQPSAAADTFSTKSHPLPWFTMPSRCGPSGPTNLLPG